MTRRRATKPEPSRKFFDTRIPGSTRTSTPVAPRRAAQSTTAVEKLLADAHFACGRVDVEDLDGCRDATSPASHRVGQPRHRLPHRRTSRAGPATGRRGRWLPSAPREARRRPPSAHERPRLVRRRGLPGTLGRAPRASRGRLRCQRGPEHSSSSLCSSCLARLTPWRRHVRSSAVRSGAAPCDADESPIRAFARPRARPR